MKGNWNAVRAMITIMTVVFIQCSNSVVKINQLSIYYISYMYISSTMYTEIMHDNSSLHGCCRGYTCIFLKESPEIAYNTFDSLCLFWGNCNNHKTLIS